MVQYGGASMDNGAISNKIIRFQFWYLILEVNGKSHTNFYKD